MIHRVSQTPLVLGVLISLFCLAAQWAPLAFERLVNEDDIVVLRQPGEWTFEIDRLKPGIYFFSAGRPRGLCDVLKDGTLIESNKSPIPDTAERLLVSKSFEVNDENKPKILQFKCERGDHYGDYLTHSPIITRYRTGQILHLWRFFNDMLLGPLCALFLGFTIVLSWHANAGSIMAPLQKRYVLFSVAATLHSLSLSHVMRPLSSIEFASDYHRILTTFLYFSFTNLLWHWIPRRRFLREFYVFGALISIVSSIVGDTNTDRNVYYYFYPLLSLVSIYVCFDLFQKTKSNREVNWVKVLAVTWGINSAVSFFILITGVAVPYPFPVFYAVFDAILIVNFMRLQRKQAIELQQIQTKAKIAEEIEKVSRQVAHDIRGPISALKTAALALSKNHIEEQGELLALVKNATDRIMAISSDVLGRKERNSESNFVIADEVLPFYFQDLKRELSLNEFKHIHINFEFEPGIIKIEPTVLLRIIGNVSKNSIESMQQQLTGSLTVRGERRVRSYAVMISDTGPGLPDQIKDNPRCGVSIGKKEGNGLGLSYIFEKTAAYGGTVEIDSSSDGTTISIELPLAR